MKRTSIVIPIVAALALATSCTGSNPQTSRDSNGTDADRAAISATLNEYAAAWKLSDTGRLVALYAPDAIIMPTDHVVERGAAAIANYNKMFFDEYTPGDFVITQEETQISGDLAFNRGSFSFSATPKAGGASIQDRGKYVVIMARQSDGTWKWTRDIDNSDGMPAANAEGKTK